MEKNLNLKPGDLVTDPEGRYGIVLRVERDLVYVVTASVGQRNTGYRSIYGIGGLTPVLWRSPSTESVNFASIIPWMVVG